MTAMMDAEPCVPAELPDPVPNGNLSLHSLDCLVMVSVLTRYGPYYCYFCYILPHSV